jgi:hypothetical protein
VRSRADARLGLGEHGAGLEIGDALFERRDLLQQLLTLAFSRRGSRGRIERDIERRLAVHRDLDATAPEGGQAR